MNSSTIRHNIEAVPAFVSITKGNSKIGKHETWSYSTMPGAGLMRYASGEAVSNVAGTCAGVCQGCEKACYARKAALAYSSTAICWSKNTLALRENSASLYIAFARKYKSARNKPRYFRFHVAGEFMPGEAGMKELLELAQVARDYPQVIVYGYTKRTVLLAQYEARFGELPKNLVIMASIWRDTVTNYTNAPEFIYDDGTDTAVTDLPHCPAVDANGKPTGKTCEKCGICQHARKGQRVAVYAH